MNGNALTGNSLGGYLRLRASAAEGGPTRLAESGFSAPIHLSKAHLSDDGLALVLSIQNPTAGFFDGDRVEVDVSVEAHANLVLSTPGSARVFGTRFGKAAVCHQRFQIRKDAFLEWIPEPFIPHAGAEYKQHTTIELQEGAGLLFFDWIAPGRVAMGEVFEFNRLQWSLDLLMDGKLLARERYSIAGGAGGPEGITGLFPAGHYISIHAAGMIVENWPGRDISNLGSADVYIGHGDLCGPVKVVRALCRTSLEARYFVEEIRKIFYRQLHRTAPSLGRIFM